MGLILKWHIEKIILMPFGGLTIFHELINKPLKEEFLITIMGPIFQIIFTFVLNNSFVNSISYPLLLFNLLPIYPLDGSKILNIILNKFFSFKMSYKYLGIISLICIILLFFKFNLIKYLSLSILLYHLINYIKEEKQTFNRFLLERYLNKINFKKLKNVNNIKEFKRDYRHLIKYKNTYLTEKEILMKYFSAFH